MLGVDVSTAALDGTWRDPGTERIEWRGVVPNDPAGIRQLLRRVPTGGVVVEPTGRSGEALVRAVRAVRARGAAGAAAQGAGVLAVGPAAGEDRSGRPRRAGAVWPAGTAAAVPPLESGG